MKTSEQFKYLLGVVKTLPPNPGVYQYYDEAGKLIYVGKAKNLKKRVSSYFNKDLSGKVAVLVKKIREIKYIIVDNEYEALLLENNLIKKYLPRYNVLLKDDKTYPWICIKNEPFPRIFPTRHLLDDGSQYFGPYASVRMMNTLLDLIRQIYQVRTCGFKLTEENISSNKFRVCLEYHIHNCKGPCEGLQNEVDYGATITEITEIIKGNINSVSAQLKKAMAEFAEKYEFEKAQILKEKTELLENYQSKSLVVSQKIHNVDVFSLITDEEKGFSNFLKVINGSVIQAHTIEIKKKLDETDEELLSTAIASFRERFGSSAKEIIVPFIPDIEIPGVEVVVPKIGDKKKLLDLSERNAKIYKLDKQKQKDLVDPERHSKRILAQMMKDLRMAEQPIHIECFDNSNTQGTDAVAAMVVFKNARPSKNDYRHYNIKTVVGPDDFASMEEVVFRRYKRLLDEKQPLPQLIVVDGGKGQLSSAVNSLEKLDLRGKITIIGIAKKLEEIYFPGDSIPVYLDKKSETLKVIQQIRDEAHRFGIAHHRNKREKSLIKSELTEIEGIGYETTQKLLRKFKSVKNIRKAGIEEIQKVIGKAKTDILLKHFSLKA
jgi:excinuclease ABC subunit C